MSTKTAQSDRVDLRVDSTTKENLLRAAEVAGRTLTDFILTSATAAADDVLADRTRFVLAPKEWQRFNDLLDAPPRDIPRLRKLFKE